VQQPGRWGREGGLLPPATAHLRYVRLHHRVLKRQRYERQQHAQLHHHAAPEPPHRRRDGLDGAGLGDVPLVGLADLGLAAD
jgi:hypothetical protein